MNWDALPATEKQLACLKMFGYEPENPLSKAAAHDLLSQFEQDPGRCGIRDGNQARESALHAAKRLENLAYYLHSDCDALAKTLENAEDKEDSVSAKDELQFAIRARVEFWKDTFREPNDREGESVQAYEFYRNFGQFVKMPTTTQVAGVLSALDKYSPTWDLERPTDFFHTLKLNFPELMRI